MTVKTLLCVCGSSVALAVGAAMAQNTTTNQDTTRSTTNSFQTGGAESVERVLEQREGVWRVDVMLNKDFWTKMGSGQNGSVDQSFITPGQKQGSGLTGAPGQNENRNLQDRQGDDQGGGATVHTDDDNPSTPYFDSDRKKAGKDDQDPSVPHNAPAGQQNQPTGQGHQGKTGLGQTGQADLASQPGMIHLSGYAEADLILGEPVLHERIIVPTAGQDLGIPTSQQNRETTDPGMDQGFRGVTLISFNKESNTYDIVMLSNHHQGIKYDTGMYDAQRNRIVFRGGSKQGSGADWMNQPSQRNWQDKPLDQRDPTQRDWQDQTDRDRESTIRNPSERDPSQRDTPDRAKNPNAPGQQDRAQDQKYNLDPQHDKPHLTYNAGTGAHRGLDNVVVVLEVVDENTQRVTMYDASSSGPDMLQPQRDWQTQPGQRGLDDLDNERDDLNDDVDDLNDDLGDDLEDAGDELEDLGDDAEDRLDDLDDDDRPDALNRNRLNEQDRQNRLNDPTVTRTTQPSTTAASGEFGKIIYQATYTRAPSSMEASIRSMIDREIQVASR